MPYRSGRVQHDRHGARSRRNAVLLLLAALATLLTACSLTRQPASPVDAPVSNQHQQHTFTYVAIGASDAFGIGTNDPDRDNWPTVLSHLLGPGVHLLNLGIPGETVAEASQTELPVALDATPALITVWLGVNDIVQGVSVDAYEQQLKALLLALHQHTHARVFVGNIPDLSLLPFFGIYDQGPLRAIIARWNAAIARAVAASGSSLVDLYSTWNELAAHPEYIASDGFHPSTAGAKRLAAMFQSRIAPSLPALRAAAGTS
ncbi:MAG: SGNH/GDSL hydrolase family protein [Nitrososphaerota archaeon]